MSSSLPMLANLFSFSKAVIFKNCLVYAHYGITHRCNLRCKMCAVYQDAENYKELSCHDIDQVFTVLRSLGLIYVSIGGGEPLLRNDLPDVVRTLRQKGLLVRLLTNGTLADASVVKDLIEAGLRDVSVSLDTLDSNKQDDIYGKKGAWEDVVDGLDRFIRFLPRKSRVVINTVVSPLNIEELVDLTRFAEEKGCYISFIPIEKTVDERFSFAEENLAEIDRVYDRLIEAKKKRRGNIFNSSRFLQISKDYLKSRQPVWRCDAGNFYISINPSGEFSACHKFKSEMSLKDSGFKEYFLSRDFKRKSLDKRSSCGGCLRPCWAEVSFLLNDIGCFWGMARNRFFS